MWYVLKKLVLRMALNFSCQIAMCHKFRYVSKKLARRIDLIFFCQIAMCHKFRVVFKKLARKIHSFDFFFCQIAMCHNDGYACHLSKYLSELSCLPCNETVLSTFQSKYYIQQTTYLIKMEKLARKIALIFFSVKSQCVVTMAMHVTNPSK